MGAFLALLPQLFNLVAGAFGVDTTSEETKVKLVQIEMEARKLIADNMAGQLDVNKAEAAAPNRTWLTWRELIGYVCAMAFAYHYVIQQVLGFIFNAAGHPVVLPPLDTSELMTILMGMLGLGGVEGAQHFINSKYNSETGKMPD